MPALTAAALLAAGTLQADPVIYEPFDDLDPSLNGNTPGLGLTGAWSAAASVAGTSLSYGSLATSGGHATAASSNYGKNWADPGSTLTGAGLMADGATLWFSALVVSYTPQVGDNDTARTYISIGNGTADGFDRVGSNADGRGFSLKTQNGIAYAHGWKGNGAFGGSGSAVADGTHLFVGKITWGEFGVTDDTVELFLPGTNLALPGEAVSTTAWDFDQLGTVNADDAFDTISFAGGHLANAVPEVDEIRYGATYEDVTPSAAASADPKITSITSVSGGSWELILAGEADTDYVFYESTTLDFTPGTLVTGLTASVGTIGGGSNEVVTLDGSGNATVQMTLGGSKNFVRAQTAP